MGGERVGVPGTPESVVPTPTDDERIVVAITGAPGCVDVIQRAARLAVRAGGELIGVHVASHPDLVTLTDTRLDEHRALLTSLGGACREVVADDVAVALVRTAKAERATQLVIGSTGQSRWTRVARRTVVDRVVGDADGIDVLVVSHGRGSDATERLPRPARRPQLAAGRRVAGWALAIAGIPLLTVALVSLQTNLNVTSSVLLYLLLVTVVAVVGGRLPALAAAVGTALVVNWFFTPPLHSLSIASLEHLLALSIFLAVAVLVSAVVTQATQRGADMARARASAEALARVAGDVVGEEDPLRYTVGLLHSTFALDGVTVLERADGGTAGDDAWVLVEAAGSALAHRPADGEALALDETSVLVLAGGPLSADDRHLLRVFVAQLGVALERRRLRAGAAEAVALAQSDRLRTAILRAVSHDLRTPLASIKASVTTMLQDDVDWSDEQRNEFLRTVDLETDRLNRLVGNLLDMSRIEAGALEVTLEAVPLEEVVAAALAGLSGPAAAMMVDVSEDLPPALADAALLERAVANVVANARRFSPADAPVQIRAALHGPRLHLRVVDHGPGVAPIDRALIFEPFQRLGDQDRDTGVGLGLAVARGFIEALGGELVLDDTPGGGLTVTIDVATAGHGSVAAATPVVVR